ncbi:MAG: class I SAM-dependent methyltransferase [Elusimicrobiota bacterium]|jgi:SAM-dependent methyltransferase
MKAFSSLFSRRKSREALGWRERYYAYIPPQRDEAFVRALIDGVARLVDLSDRARVLDFGCGTGRQTVELARRGCRVLGVDSDAPRLSDARSFAGKTLWVHFTRKDLGNIGYREEFGVAVNLHHPLGRGDEDDLRCLQAVHQALKARGKLLLDLPSRDWLVRHLDSRSSMGERASFDLRKGRFQESGGGLRIYTLTELERMLAKAGFDLVSAHGSWEGEPFSLESMRMIVLAQKVQAPRPSARRDDGLPRAIRIKGRGR